MSPTSVTVSVRPPNRTIRRQIEAELAETIGLALHERTEGAHQPTERTPARTLSTTAGDLEQHIPKLRTGSFFLSVLERRRPKWTRRCSPS
jgi:putative transposase